MQLWIGVVVVVAAICLATLVADRLRTGAWFRGYSVDRARERSEHEQDHRIAPKQGAAGWGQGPGR